MLDLSDEMTGERKRQLKLSLKADGNAKPIIKPQQQPLPEKTR